MGHRGDLQEDRLRGRGVCAAERSSEPGSVKAARDVGREKQIWGPRLFPNRARAYFRRRLSPATLTAPKSSDPTVGSGTATIVPFNWTFATSVAVSKPPVPAAEVAP